MTQERVVWHLNSDNYLKLEGLLNEITGDYPVDATVTLTLKTRAGANVVGVVDLPVAYISGTGEASLYRVMAEDTVTIPVGSYTGVVTAVKSGVKETFYVPITMERG